MSYSTRWLPSDTRWIERVLDLLIDGEIVLVRGLPRTGKSTLCETIAHELGDTACSVFGARVDEANQGTMRERIGTEVAARIEANGCAQLVFDDYGKAIRRSQGGQLHSFLYGLLVDGPFARDTGVLLTSRHGDDLDLRFSGSPLLSRAQVLSLPETDIEDAAELGLELATLRALAGSSTAFARRMLGQEASTQTFALVEYLRVDRSRLAADLPPAVTEVLLGAEQPTGSALRD